MQGPDAAELFERFERAFESGTEFQLQRQRLMLEIAGVVSHVGSVPTTVESRLREAIDAWTEHLAPDPDLLLRSKLAIWRELESKNGDSVTIIDLVDRTLRSSLCLTELAADRSEALELAGWAAEMLSSEPWPRQTKYF